MNAIPFWFSIILNAGVLERVWKLNVMDWKNLVLQLLVGFEVIDLQTNLFALRDGQMAVVLLRSRLLSESCTH